LIALDQLLSDKYSLVYTVQGTVLGLADHHNTKVYDVVHGGYWFMAILLYELGSDKYSLIYTIHGAVSGLADHHNAKVYDVVHGGYWFMAILLYGNIVKCK
jgi:fructose-1,6-bisphosphatase/inositol monophosphatase family enzyme